MKFYFDKKIIFFFFLSAIIILSVLIIFYFNAQKVKLTSNLVEHTEEVLSKSDNILLDLLNIEGGSRSFILTGNIEFLEPFNIAMAKIDSDFVNMAILVKDNYAQQLRLDSLKTIVNEKIIFTKTTIKVRTINGLYDTEQIIKEERGKYLTNKIRNLIANINSEEFRLLKERKNVNRNSNNNFQLMFILLLACVVIVIFIIIINLKNQRLKNTIAEKEKQISQYSRSLIEASLDPLVTISAEGKITDVNIAAVRVTGILKNDLIGTDFSNYFTEPENAHGGYQQAFAKGSISDYPLTVKHKNGMLTDVLYNASVYKDDKGNILGVFAAARDVTEQKKASELIEERTTQLQSVNKELEAFTYSVSHDLRAPLRAINGYANILQEDYISIIDEEGKSSLNSILKNSKKMGELIDDLLAFSRLGRKIIPTSEINMSVLVRTVRDEELVGYTGKIDFLLPELLPALGQQVLIKQVWINLISNALKYSKHNPAIKIEIGSYYKDNRVVYFVKDNGVGFDMQYYDKLFGVFQRLHSQEEFEGTGIGLAIVQKIIQRHNGTVWAESILNQGSSFYFSLPVISN